MITLRTLNQNDVSSFRHVRLFALQECPTAFGASYAQEEKLPATELERRLEMTPDRWVLGAFNAEQLIGMIGFIRETGDKSRHKGFIWGMYVSPEFRGQGVGRELIESALVRIDATAGLRRVRLCVIASNQVALRLYKKVGFVIDGTEEEALCVDGVFHTEFHLTRPTGKNREPLP